MLRTTPPVGPVSAVHPVRIDNTARDSVPEPHPA
ncbi:hypothetical protein SUDANB140_04124 [Streptomyces sp. enrichment culture]